MSEKTRDLQLRYSGVIADLQGEGRLKRKSSIKESAVWSVEGTTIKLAVHAKDAKKRRVRATRYSIITLMGFIVFAPLLSTLHPSPALAWRWDEEEADTKDELDVQLDGYHARVETGISMQERVVLLDRLIKLFKVHKRDTAALEEERSQVLADEQAVQNVSEQSRQKSQLLYKQAFDKVRIGNFMDAQKLLMDAEHLNPTDKMVTDLRQKIDGVVVVMPAAPEDPASGDLVRRGITEYLQNEPSKSLNYLLYAQQKDPNNKSIPDLVELVKRAYPNESSDMLDARLNLIDQKLQKALEKIYGGEYLVAAKECQEVLDLEPDNALALTRLGSVYYAMGQVKQARTYWKQALAVDANNDVLKSFLQQSSTESDRAPTQALTYKVQKGDTLMTIAEKIYKNREFWRKLYDANRSYLKNPYALVVGQVLVLPPGVAQAQ
jgi:tetratricopeptide (TPR) repeat protein